MTQPPITKDAFPHGDSDLEEIYPYVYDELRRLAAYYMKQERSNHTLQPTALVHEAYLRLFKQENHEFTSRTHFISVAANMMRRILVNHAVRRNRDKREGKALRITLDRAVDSFAEDNLDLLALDEALKRFGEIDERAARIFELRFFGGLTVDEIAEVVDLSAATVKREWSVARIFLRRELFGSTN
ncbi:MAG: ECF-type sigma factor [Pyrinomonadaceae bacterium]